MLDNGIEPVESHFWFIGPQSKSGYGLQLTSWVDDGTMFTRAIDELGLGRSPAVLFETRTEPVSARFYPQGLAEPDDYQRVWLVGESVTTETVVEVVDNLYRQALVTPTAQRGTIKLWKSAKESIPVKDVELEIQGLLRGTLIGAFPTCRVEAEQPLATGRFDLEVFVPSSSQEDGFIRQLLLELKVLRAFHSSGTTVPATDVETAVKEGMTQAAAYAKEHGVPQRALFCFDMRKKPSEAACFATIEKRARELKVTLHLWHLFADSKSYRDWLAGNEIAA